MTTMTMTAPSPRGGAASAALTGAATLWWLVAILGQWAFFYYIAAFYGVSTLHGNIAAWSKNTMLAKGYVPGDTAGNAAFGAHALLAGYMAFGGVLQLIPQIRTYAPGFHRWNGRVFLAMAFALSAIGFYLVWVRGGGTGEAADIAIGINGVLIVTFAALAWRAALKRDFAVHRRWALRTFLVANGQWFVRIGVVPVALINGGFKGIGPFFTFWSFGCYLVPLAILELYLRAKDSGSPRAQYAMAGALIAVAILMAVGIVGFSVFTWQKFLSA